MQWDLLPDMKNYIRDVGSTDDFFCFSLILDTPGTPGTPGITSWVFSGFCCSRAKVDWMGLGWDGMEISVWGDSMSMMT